MILHSSDFSDAMYANFLLRYVSAMSRVISHSKTLIDNIFSNMIEDGSTSGNFVSPISSNEKFKSLKKTLQIQNYIIRNSKRSMKREWKMIYKILARTNHVNLYIAPLILSLIKLDH